jgi:hypothetical protein
VANKPEANEQIKVAKFLEMIGALYTCSIAGAYLSVGQLTQVKRMGYTKGTPDIMVFQPGSPYVHGLLIEMKSDTGTASPEQKAWGKKAEENGYRYVVCHGAEEAISVIRNYMGV